MHAKLLRCQLCATPGLYTPGSSVHRNLLEVSYFVAHQTCQQHIFFVIVMACLFILRNSRSFFKVAFSKALSWPIWFPFFLLLFFKKLFLILIYWFGCIGGHCSITDLSSQPGSNPGSLDGKYESLATGPPGKSSPSLFLWSQNKGIIWPDF